MQQQRVHAKMKRNKHGKKAGADCSLSQWLLKWDAFGSPILFNYDDQNQMYQSTAGTCISLLASMVTLAFIVQ